MEDDFDLTCACGSENFERVVVKRLQRHDYRTDFVACVLCRVMYFLPEPAGSADPHLERDAKIAAEFYRKPGRR